MIDERSYGRSKVSPSRILKFFAFPGRQRKFLAHGIITVDIQHCMYFSKDEEDGFIKLGWQ